MRSEHMRERFSMTDSEENNELWEENEQLRDDVNRLEKAWKQDMAELDYSLRMEREENEQLRHDNFNAAAAERAAIVAWLRADAARRERCVDERIIWALDGAADDIESGAHLAAAKEGE
jgi:hypothetical protein